MEIPRVVIVDHINDLALLKVGGHFPSLAIGDERTASLGNTVYTVGFPHPDVQDVAPKCTRDEITAVTGLQRRRWGVKGGTGVWQYLESRPSLLGTNVDWTAIRTGTPPTAVMNRYVDPAAAEGMIYRIKAVRP